MNIQLENKDSNRHNWGIISKKNVLEGFCLFLSIKQYSHLDSNLNFRHLFTLV